MNITVLMGGTSAERDVSLASGLRVAQALRERGHDVTAMDTAHGVIGPDQQRAMLAGTVVKTEPPSQETLRAMGRETLPQMLRRLPGLAEADVIFLGLHGGHGEDGTIQAMLDLTGVPYTGSGHLASALAMDKDLSKRLFRSNDVLTAAWTMVTQDGDMSAAEAMGVPVVVKPSKQGSTVGLTVVKQPHELKGAIELAFRYDDEVMVEEFIPGREMTVGVLGDLTFPVGEIIPKHEIYDYECKYTAGMAEEEFPARITEEQSTHARELALRAFRALKLSGCARVDFRMTENGDFYCLEANTLPGMTQLSLIPQGAAASGIGFPELCERIVELALADHATRTR